MTTLEDSIRQAIDAYLARSRLSERNLGAFVTGDTAFIPRVRAGGSMRLDTADRLLIYMNEEPIGPAFRNEGRGVPVRDRHRGAQVRVQGRRQPRVRDEAPARGDVTAFHCPAGAGVDARPQG